jgi:hypothetical protein
MLCLYQRRRSWQIYLKFIFASPLGILSVDPQADFHHGLLIIALTRAPHCRRGRRRNWIEASSMVKCSAHSPSLSHDSPSLCSSLRCSLVTSPHCLSSTTSVLLRKDRRLTKLIGSAVNLPSSSHSTLSTRNQESLLLWPQWARLSIVLLTVLNADETGSQRE